MARYFFHIDCENPFVDETGVDLQDDGVAWREAMRLTRDVESNLAPGQRWHLKVCDGAAPVYRIVIATERQRR
jgi:hypothetical protein